MKAQETTSLQLIRNNNESQSPGQVKERERTIVFFPSSKVSSLCKAAREFYFYFSLYFIHNKDPGARPFPLFHVPIRICTQKRGFSLKTSNISDSWFLSFPFCIGTRLDLIPELRLS
jgi:hypothetical protein